ncbi:MAG: hypothetical protein ACTSQC_01255 [Candidatus Heimdallarchaeaceae archaeon]
MNQDDSTSIDSLNLEWSFTSSELVSSGNDDRSYYQEMDVDSKGNIHVVWKELNGTYMYRVWDINTQVWQPIHIIASTTSNGFAGIGITIDNSDNIHIAWSDDADYQSSGIDFDVFYTFWNSTSLNWNETSVVSTESDRVSFMPIIKVDNDNNIHFLWYDHTDYQSCGTDWDVFYKCWDASTMNFNSTVVVSTESDLDSYRGSMDIQSTGNLEIAWYDKTNLGTNGDDWDIFFKFYVPKTEYWSNVRVLSIDSVNNSYHPDVFVDTKDNVHVTWQDLSDYNGAGEDSDIFYTFWNRTTTSWNGTTVVSTESTDISILAGIAVDELQNVFFSWYEYTAYQDPDPFNEIYFKYWDGSSHSWNSSQVITDDNTDGADLSENCPISVDRWGNVHILWEDNSTISGAGDDYDIFYKRLDLSSIQSPVLQAIDPNPSTTGNIDLQWSSVPFVEKYSIYRSVSHISSVSGLTPITEIDSTSFDDYGLSDGTHYYVIIASNPYLDSMMSNEESVDIEIPVVHEYPINILLAVGVIGVTTLILMKFRLKIKK